MHAKPWITNGGLFCCLVLGYTHLACMLSLDLGGWIVVFYFLLAWSEAMYGT